MILNSDIQGSFKKFSLLFCQPEMVFVVIWFFDHFSLEPVPPMNSIWIIALVSHLHVWVTKFKPSLMFFKLLVLISNNVIWVNFSASLFDKTQHVVKRSTKGHGLVCYEVINLLIESQSFLLMGLLCSLKSLYLIITACDGLFMFFHYCFYAFLGEPFY